MQNKHVSGFSIESDYEYVLGEVKGKLLSLEAVLKRPSDFLDWEMEHIGEEMVSTAKWFAENQRLRRTGQLIDHISYALTPNGVMLYDDVQNPRNDFYAGHQEFGYHTWQGQFIQARPFLRPAMRAVQQASLGRLSTAALEVSGFADGMSVPTFNKNGVFGINSRYMRKFYRNTEHNYTVEGLKAKTGGRISENLGKSYSINRRDSSASGVNYYSNYGRPYTTNWDSPYTAHNTNKMSYIYTGNNYKSW